MLPQNPGPITRIAQQIPLAGDSIKPPSLRNPLLRTLQQPAFADGGKVETAEELLRRMSGKYGVGGGSPSPAPAPAQPAPQPVAQPTAKGIGGAFDALKNRKVQIDKAVDGYAGGGKIKSRANGGKIKGRGTSTSDSIPAKVSETGEPIAVSTTERILSGAQDDFLEQEARAQGFKSLDDKLESGTGRPVGPTIKAGRKAAADGLTPNSNPLADVIRNGNSFSQNLSAPQPVSTPAPVEPVVRNAYGNDMAATNKMQRAIDTMQGAAGPATSSISANPLAAMASTVSQRPSLPATNAAFRAGSAEDPRAANPLVAMAKPDAPYHEAERNAPDQIQTTVDSMFPPVKRYALGGQIDPNRDYSIPEEQQIAAKQAIASAPASASPTLPARSQAVNPLTQTIQPGAQERTFSAIPTAAQSNPLLSDNYRPMTSPRQSSFTEIGTKENQANPLTTINMNANNESLARANAIRQGDETGPKVAMLGNSGLAETQALMAKWGREDSATAALQEIARNPKAAGAIASLVSSQQNNETNRTAHQLTRDATAETNAAHVRGQDVVARTHAAELAGNPLVNELTKAKTATLQSTLDDQRTHAAMVAEINNPATDPERRKIVTDALMAAQGKNSINSERLTLPQVRTNLEIDSARQAIAGLSPEEIRRRTAKTTNTGRENPDFDPYLEHAVNLSGRRKIGDDPVFDERQTQATSQYQGTDGDAITRFRTDPAMKGHTLGKQTAYGTEVFDSTGKLIGHYR